MKTFLKIIGVISNILCFAAGIWVSVTMLFELDFCSVLFIPGMSSAESLYFNMIMFVVGVAALMFVVPALSEEKAQSVEFPTMLAIIPLIISVIGIITSFTLWETREKIIVILSSILYFLLSGTIIYNGAKIFQMNK